MKFKFLKILVFLACSGIYAQSKPTTNVPAPEPTPEIQVVARVQKDKILLRWGVTTPIAWKKLNKYGYQLERYTVTRDNTTLTVPEKVILSANIKPEPAENWETIVNTNDNAAIIAQALYGESFEVKAGTSAFENIVNQSEEIEQRFSYALFTADQDFNIAKKAGLGFEDTTVKKNEMYLYKVISNVPMEELEIRSNGKFTGLKEYEALPKPMDFTASFGNNSTMLSWNFKVLSHAYGSYHVERSLDKKNFERITKKPYTGMNQENENNSRIFYVDSIANNQMYSYRVQGISVFGELSPYSDIMSGKGKAVLQYVPHLTVKDFKDDTTVTFTWEFPEEGNNEITGFELNRSDQDNDKYETVIKNIPPKSRNVTYSKLSPTNYFTITALGKQGSNRISFPMLVQPVDSIPPVKPIGLKGIIDSLGIVKISWEPNKEKDLQGYRIYRSNNPNEEYSQLTVNPDPKNNYQDKVVIKSLNGKVYYKVIAVDNRYNMSPFSEVLVIKKPDVIPPTSPVFSSYEVKEGSVFLEWVNSQSDDVQSQLLYRKMNDEKDWTLLQEDKNKTEKYQDKSIEEGNTYRYAIFAKDETKLVSKPSPEVALFVPKASLMPAVKGFYAQFNTLKKTIDLSWNYKEKDVESFEIYKGTDKDPLQLMQVVIAETRLFSDPSISINTSYKYAIRVLFKDGRASKMEFFNIKY
jgi:uncharacterized protein